MHWSSLTISRAAAGAPVAFVHARLLGLALGLGLGRASACGMGASAQTSARPLPLAIFWTNRLNQKYLRAKHPDLHYFLAASCAIAVLPCHQVVCLLVMGVGVLVLEKLFDFCRVCRLFVGI